MGRTFAFDWEESLKLRIKPHEIISIVEEAAQMQEDDPDAESDILGLLLHRYAQRRDGCKRVFCIHARMMCLADLMQSDDPRLKGYMKATNDPTCTVTSAAILYATALCPVRTANEQTRFDPDEFFEIALRNAESEGNA